MLGLKPQNSVATQTSAVEPWQQRVIDEHAELDKKIGALAAFLAGERFSTLPSAEKARLTHQLSAMQEYRSILSERIAAWDEPAPIVGDSGTSMDAVIPVELEPSVDTEQP